MKSLMLGRFALILDFIVACQSSVVLLDIRFSNCSSSFQTSKAAVALDRLVLKFAPKEATETTRKPISAPSLANYSGFTVEQPKCRGIISSSKSGNQKSRLCCHRSQGHDYGNNMSLRIMRGYTKTV